MSKRIYKIIELVGSSTESWEDAARNAVEVAGVKLKDLRVAEVVKQDLRVNKGRVLLYRTRLKVSFKYRTKK